MGLFYGSQKSTPATQLTLFIDKVYNNREEMEENVSVDEIFIGRYVLINYGENGSAEETENASKDLERYEDRFNHTIWMKQYTPNGDKYIQVGSLDAKMAKLTLVPDLPASTIDPQIDTNDATWEVTLHMPRNWVWDTDPKHLDIGAELFDPNWRLSDTASLSADAVDLRSNTITLPEYIGTPSFGFETTTGVTVENDEGELEIQDIKTLKGNLRVLGGLVEQAYEILYGHKDDGRNMTWFTDDPNNYNDDTNSLLGLLNMFLQAAHNNDIADVVDDSAFRNFIANLANINQGTVQDVASDIGLRLRTIINNIVKQIIGLPLTGENSYTDFIAEGLANSNIANSLIKLLNNKHYNQLSDINELLAYLNEEDIEPILNLYTLTMLGRYLLATVGSALTSMAKPNHLKAFKFNKPIGGSLKNLSADEASNWRDNLNFHMYLEDNASDGWFNYARGGLMVTADIDGSVRCLAYLPRKTADQTNPYFVENNKQKTHFNVDLSASPADQEAGWITWRDHGENVINTGSTDFDNISWATETIVNTLAVDTVFTATIFYNIDGVFLYEQKKLRLLAAPYYLYVYDTGDNFEIQTAESAREEIQTAWDAKKEEKGWSEETSSEDVEYLLSYEQYKKALETITGDVYRLKAAIKSKIYPMNTGDLHREYGAVAEITDAQNRASRGITKKVYIFSRFPVDETIELVGTEDEEGHPLTAKNVYGFKLLPSGAELGASRFTGGFSKKEVVYRDSDSNFVYNYLYISDIADPIDAATHSALEMIITPEPSPEDQDDITLELTPFVGAKDTNVDLGIAGLRGDGTWSHLRANAGVEINFNTDDELVIQHTNVYEGESNILAPIAKTAEKYASAEEVATSINSSDTETEVSIDTGVSNVVYHKYTTTYKTVTSKSLDDEGNTVVRESSEQKYGNDTFEAATDAQFTFPETDLTVTESEWAAFSKAATQEEVIKYFTEKCVPNEFTRYDLVKTVVTQRVWDNDYGNDFNPCEQIATYYNIVKYVKNSETQEETSTIIDPVSEDTVSRTVVTHNLGLDCTLYLPYLEIDTYGHVTSARMEEFHFFEAQNFEIQNEGNDCKLIYRYPSGEVNSLFDLPIFTGSSLGWVENTTTHLLSEEYRAGKSGLVPAPNLDITKSIAFQNELAYKSEDDIKLFIAQIRKYCQGYSFKKFLQEKVNEEYLADYITGLNGANVSSTMEDIWNNEIIPYINNSYASAIEESKILDEFNSTIVGMKSIDILKEVSKNETDETAIPSFLTEYLFDYLPGEDNILTSILVEKDSMLEKTNDGLEMELSDLHNTENSINVVINELKAIYNDYYSVLQGNGTWGPIMYDYHLTFKGRENGGWNTLNSVGDAFITEISLPGLKERFATFIDLDMGYLNNAQGQEYTQENIDKILTDWKQIDRVYCEDGKIIASCAVDNNVVPIHDLQVIVKVVIR